MADLRRELLELMNLCKQAERDADDQNTVTDDAEAYAFCRVKDTLRAMLDGENWRRVWHGEDPKEMAN